MQEGVSDRKDDKNEKRMREFLDDTSPVYMEEDVSDRKDGKNEKNDEEKQSEFPDDTSPVEMEECVNIYMMTGIKKIMREKRQNSQMKLPLLRWGRCK